MWCTTTPARAGSRGRPSAGVGWTRSPTTGSRKAIPAGSRTRPAAATHWTSPTPRLWRSPSTRCGTGPSASASTGSASIWRPRWRDSTASSPNTTRSCTRCAAICCWAISRSSWNRGIWATRDGAPDSSDYRSANGTTASAIPPGRSGFRTWRPERGPAAWACRKSPHACAGRRTCSPPIPDAAPPRRSTSYPAMTGSRSPI